LNCPPFLKIFFRLPFAFRFRFPIFLPKWAVDLFPFLNGILSFRMIVRTIEISLIWNFGDGISGWWGHWSFFSFFRLNVSYSLILVCFGTKKMYPYINTEKGCNPRANFNSSFFNPKTLKIDWIYKFQKSLFDLKFKSYYMLVARLFSIPGDSYPK